jgi:hypothetical protein
VSTDTRIRAAERALVAARAEAERLDTKPDGMEGRAWIEAMCEARSRQADAKERLIAEHLRSGKRDPRRDPRVGDVLQVVAVDWSWANLTDDEGVGYQCRRVTGIRVDEMGRITVEWKLVPNPIAPLRSPSGACRIATWRRWASVAQVRQIAGVT